MTFKYHDYFNAVRDSSLSGTEKAVAWCLLSYADYQTGTNAHPGNKLLALGTSRDEKTVKRALKQLRDLGWIVQTHNGQGARSTWASEYQLVIPEFKGTSRPVQRDVSTPTSTHACNKNSKGHHVPLKMGGDKVASGSTGPGPSTPGNEVSSALELPASGSSPKDVKPLQVTGNIRTLACPFGNCNALLKMPGTEAEARAHVVKHHPEALNQPRTTGTSSASPHKHQTAKSPYGSHQSHRGYQRHFCAECPSSHTKNYGPNWWLCDKHAIRQGLLEQ